VNSGNRKNNVIICTGDKVGLQTVPPPSSTWNKDANELTNRPWIFLSRISTNETTESVLKYMNERNLNGVECVELNTRYNTYKSFRLGVTEDIENQLLDGSFWPAGALVRKFVPTRNFKAAHNRNFLGRSRQTPSVT
jgi:hypothetical protein